MSADRLRAIIQRMRAAVEWRKGIAPGVVQGWADELETALAESDAPAPTINLEAVANVARRDEHRILCPICKGGNDFTKCERGRFLTNLLAEQPPAAVAEAGEK